MQGFYSLNQFGILIPAGSCAANYGLLMLKVTLKNNNKINIFIFSDLIYVISCRLKRGILAIISQNEFRPDKTWFFQQSMSWRCYSLLVVRFAKYKRVEVNGIVLHPV